MGSRGPVHSALMTVHVARRPVCSDARVLFSHTHTPHSDSQPKHTRSCVYTVSFYLTYCVSPQQEQHISLHIYMYMSLYLEIRIYAENGYAARAGSNTTRDSISRVAPSTGPALRVRLAARAASVPALTRGRPAVPRRPGTGRSRHTARRAALAPDELAALHAPLDDGPRHADVPGTRRMRWRANSRQMTRPSRRRSEETM
jgi:hypothetical protein